MSGTGLLELVKSGLALRTGTDGSISNVRALKDKKDDCFYQTYTVVAFVFPTMRNPCFRKTKTNRCIRNPPACLPGSTFSS